MKKASLDMGVSFAVIIILGLVILGFLLVFVLNTFKFANEKFPKNAPDIIFHARADEPILPETRATTIKTGEDASLLVSIYNNLWNPDEEIVLALGECRDSENNIQDKITLSSITQSIETQSDQGYLTIMRASEEVSPGRYICSLLAGIPSETDSVDLELPFHSTQIEIEVTN